MKEEPGVQHFKQHHRKVLLNSLKNLTLDPEVRILLQRRWFEFLKKDFYCMCLLILCRFISRTPGSPSDNDVVCTGGDNSYGLIITEPEQQQQISVNDSIIGRSSNPFIAKVGKTF